MFASFAVPKLPYLFFGPNGFSLGQFKEHRAPYEMPTSVEEKLHAHPAHLEHSITVIMSRAVNLKTWVSRQIDGCVRDQEGVNFHC